MTLAWAETNLAATEEETQAWVEAQEAKVAWAVTLAWAETNLAAMEEETPAWAEANLAVSLAAMEEETQAWVEANLADQEVSWHVQSPSFD